jgi:hypothetical protein
LQGTNLPDPICGRQRRENLERGTQTAIGMELEERAMQIYNGPADVSGQQATMRAF